MRNHSRNSIWPTVAVPCFSTQSLAQENRKLRKCLDRATKTIYSVAGCQCRFNKGGNLFRRTRYQQRSLVQEERKRSSALWGYQWCEDNINRKPVPSKLTHQNIDHH